MAKAQHIRCYYVILLLGFLILHYIMSFFLELLSLELVFLMAPEKRFSFPLRFTGHMLLIPGVTLTPASGEGIPWSLSIYYIGPTQARCSDSHTSQRDQCAACFLLFLSSQNEWSFSFSPPLSQFLSQYCREMGEFKTTGGDRRRDRCVCLQRAKTEAGRGNTYVGGESQGSNGQKI